MVTKTVMSRRLTKDLVFLFLSVLLAASYVSTGTFNHRAPRIMNKQNQSLALAGATGFIECNVKGRPKPRPYWERDGVRVERFGSRFSINKRSNALRVFRARIMDSGNYTCIAKNRHGIDSMRVELLVTMRPEIEIVQRSPLTVKEGANLEIVCRSEAWPKPTFTWITSRNDRLKSGRPMEKNHALSRYNVYEREVSDLVRESVFTIWGVSHLDLGLHICFAANRAGSTKDEIRLNVLFGPKPLPGQPEAPEVRYFYHSSRARPFSLSCDVTGNELPTVQWEYNGNPLNTAHCKVEHNPPRVRSHACTVNENTTGTYKCYASNSHGNFLIQEFDVRPLYLPGSVQVMVSRRFANRLRLIVQVGRPNIPDPDYAIVSYSPGEYVTTADFSSQGEATVVLPGLKENSEYFVSLKARNEVGLGPETELKITTGKIVSPLENFVELISSSVTGTDKSLLLSNQSWDEDGDSAVISTDKETSDTQCDDNSEGCGKDMEDINNDNEGDKNEDNSGNNTEGHHGDETDDSIADKASAYSVVGRTGKSLSSRVERMSLLVLVLNVIFIRKMLFLVST